MKKKSPELPLLEGKNLKKNPLKLFEAWFRDAKKFKAMDLPETVCLSTIDPRGRPAGRMVLLKGQDQRGFVFYTNFKSTKGRSLALKPFAALTFYWEALNRQVRVRGKVKKVSRAEADRYFQTRPRESQLAAWASEQSKTLLSRKILEDRFAFFKRKYEGKKVPRPPHWGGYLLVPQEIEFWQSRAYRLHDRFLFRRGKSGWKRLRLYP